MTMSEKSPTLSELWIADPAERWEPLGFAIKRSCASVGGVQLRFGGEGKGITSWSVSGIGAITEIDGLPTRPAESAVAIRTATHPNGATGIDHVVVVTPDFDRTAAALDAVGIPLRRVRDGGGFRQGFRRLGPVILELVEATRAPAGPARFWGLVVSVEDLDALADALGDRLGSIHPAVQSGRRIATLQRAAGVSPKVAFMTPEGR
jgi:hypothetical protein